MQLDNARLVAPIRAARDRKVDDGELRQRAGIRAEETRGNGVAQVLQSGRLRELRDDLPSRPLAARDEIRFEEHRRLGKPKIDAPDLGLQAPNVVFITRRLVRRVIPSPKLRLH